ncbi:MAG: hypothetical protein ABIF77_05420 [bacterium]
MNYEVTREVVNDLWPLYRSGDASGDSQKLVDQFLAGNPDFAEMLKKSSNLSTAMPSLQLSPEAECQLLDDAQKRARLKLLIIGGGIALAGFIMIGALIGAMLIVFRGGGLG